MDKNLSRIKSINNAGDYFTGILKKYLQHGDYDNCTAFYEANRGRELSGEALFFAAASYSAKSDYTKAIELFSKAYKKDGNPLCLKETGVNYIRLNDFGNAARYLSEFINQKPDTVSGRYYLGLAYKSLNDFENALGCFTSYLKQTDSPDAWHQTAEILYELARFKESITAGLETVRLAPRHGQAHKLIAKSYYNLLNYEESLRYFSEYEKILPPESPDFEMMFYSGKMLCILGRDEAGRKYLFRILETHPRDIGTMELLFDSYHKYSDWPGCIETGERILKTSLVLKIVAHLAIIYYTVKDFKNSEEKIEILLAKGFESGSALKIIVTSFINIAEYEKALFYAEKLLSLEENDGNFYLKGLILYNLKRFKNSSEIYQGLVTRNPSDEKIRFEYARALYATKEKIKAFTNLRYLLDRNVSYPEALYLLAQICFEYQDWSQPVPYIKSHLEKNPANDRAWFILAMCYENLRQLLLAVKCMNKAVTLNRKEEKYKTKRIELIKKFYLAAYGRY